jgi:hypothetical protein
MRGLSSHLDLQYSVRGRPLGDAALSHILIPMPEKLLHFRGIVLREICSLSRVLMQVIEAAISLGRVVVVSAGLSSFLFGKPVYPITPSRSLCHHRGLTLLFRGRI